MLPTLNAWLREQRLSRGWTVAEMGRQLQHAAKATGDRTVPRTAILASYVRRWEAGKIGLTERYRLHYCTALSIPPTQFGPQRPHAQPPELSDLPVGMACGEVMMASVVASPDVDLVDDYEALGEYDETSGYRGAGQGRNGPEPTARSVDADSPDLVMTMIAEESLDFGEWADTSNTGDATLEHYAAQVRLLASDYQHVAPYPLLLETRRLRDRIFAKLRGHQRPGQTRELYLIAAQVCGLLAWMSGDMSFYRAADAHAWTGWVCAEHAGHDGARTWIRATQSKLAYWDARFIESAQLAEDGLRYRCPDSGQIMVALFHGRALARLGRGREADGALSRARAGLETAAADEVGGLWSVIPARFHSLASNIQIWRRDPAEALAEAGQALEQFETASPRERNYGAEIHTRIDQALAQLLMHDLDGADAALRPVLALAPDNRYEPITQHLRQTRQALALPGFSNTTRARQLQEEIEAYCQESIVNGLAGETLGMTTSGPQRYQDALQQACTLAGLDARDAVLLHIRGNAVYHLPRGGVIVRLRLVPGPPGAVRQQFTAALQTTAWLRRHGYPATEPLDLDQPIAVDGHLATFWRYETVINTNTRDLTALGKLIRRLHSLSNPDASLPPANPLGSLRADLNSTDAITPADRQWLLAEADELEDRYRHAQWALGTGLIHGDAHADNLLHTPSGVVLGDWDSVSHGPRELDLVPTSMWYRYGRPRAEWDTFSASYDVDPRSLPSLPLLQKLRELHALAAYVRNASDDAYRAELTRRVASLKAGNHTLPWRAL